MTRAVTAVAFRPDAPISLFDWALKTMSTPDGPVRYMDCVEVGETSYGFLVLVPKDGPEGGGEFGIYVPPSYILWMLRSTAERRPGFL